MWGNKKIYQIGAIRNIILAKQFYPDFICWFYIHKESVSTEIIKKLEKFDNVKIIYKYGNIKKIKPRMWRFEPIFEPEVELFISRDLDTKILLREKLAVDEWLASDSLLHIMRDHPWHKYPIQAGMFGIKKSNISYFESMNNFVQKDDYLYDQIFLAYHIYPLYIDNCIIHASFNKIEGDKCRNFPIDLILDNYRFVGEYVNEFEERNNKNVIEIIRGYI